MVLGKFKPYHSGKERVEIVTEGVYGDGRRRFRLEDERSEQVFSQRKTKKKTIFLWNLIILFVDLIVAGSYEFLFRFGFWLPRARHVNAAT